MTRASIEIGWSSRLPFADYVAMVAQVGARGPGSSAEPRARLGLCHVADGRTDGYCELHINSWDVAAGIVIARKPGRS